MTQTITFVDETSPVITTNDQILEATIVGGTNFTIEMPLVDDIQDVNITNDAPEVFPLGETIVTWTATDSSGNSASATQTITVVDTTSPIIEQPENIISEATNHSDNIVELQMIVSSDNTEILSITNDAPSSFGFGTTTVTWTVVDIIGNQSTMLQEIDIVDTTIPTISTPSNVQVEATSMENTIVDYGFAQASDQVEVSSTVSYTHLTLPTNREV